MTFHYLIISKDLSKCVSGMHMCVGVTGGVSVWVGVGESECVYYPQYNPQWADLSAGFQSYPEGVTPKYT